MENKTEQPIGGFEKKFRKQLAIRLEGNLEDPKLSQVASEAYVDLKTNIDNWLLNLENPLEQLEMYYYQELLDQKYKGCAALASFNVDLLNPYGHFEIKEQAVLERYEVYEQEAMDLLKDCEDKDKQESNTCLMM